MSYGLTLSCCTPAPPPSPPFGRSHRLGLPMVVCVECLPADKPWDVVSATRRSSGVAPRACVRVYARVLVPPNLYMHTNIHTIQHVGPARSGPAPRAASPLASTSTTLPLFLHQLHLLHHPHLFPLSLLPLHQLLLHLPPLRRLSLLPLTPLPPRPLPHLLLRQPPPTLPVCLLPLLPARRRPPPVLLWQPTAAQRTRRSRLHIAPRL